MPTGPGIHVYTGGVTLTPDLNPESRVDIISIALPGSSTQNGLGSKFWGSGFSVEARACVRVRLCVKSGRESERERLCIQGRRV